MNLLKILKITYDAFLQELVNDLPPKKPKKVSVELINEENGMLRYKITPNSATAPDVVKRKISINIDGNMNVQEYGIDEEVPNLELEQDQVAAITEQQIDDNNNISSASDPYVFTANDTLAPPTPGQISVELIEEV
jgi:hypothetical protein